MTRCYAWPLSVTAGAELQLHVSTEHGRFGVRLFRSGATVEEVDAKDARRAGCRLILRIQAEESSDRAQAG